MKIKKRQYLLHGCLRTIQLYNASRKESDWWQNIQMHIWNSLKTILVHLKMYLNIKHLVEIFKYKYN